MKSSDREERTADSRSAIRSHSCTVLSVHGRRRSTGLNGGVPHSRGSSRSPSNARSLDAPASASRDAGDSDGTLARTFVHYCHTNQSLFQHNVEPLLCVCEFEAIHAPLMPADHCNRSLCMSALATQLRRRMVRVEELAWIRTIGTTARAPQTMSSEETKVG
jgi:hypothetical protein